MRNADFHEGLSSWQPVDAHGGEPRWSPLDSRGWPVPPASATGVLGSRISTTLEPYWETLIDAGWVLLEFASPPPGGSTVHWLAGGEALS